MGNHNYKIHQQFNFIIKQQMIRLAVKIIEVSCHLKPAKLCNYHQELQIGSTDFLFFRKWIIYLTLFYKFWFRLYHRQWNFPNNSTLHWKEKLIVSMLIQQFLDVFISELNKRQYLQLERIIIKVQHIPRNKMFKNLCRIFQSQSSLAILNERSLRYFSTKVSPECMKLQDWEYVQRIAKQMKSDNINEALKYLIQSHLNKQILNKQIYFSFYEKIQQLSLPKSYHQILYKLYRQHFQPNTMTLDWMRKVIKTQNQSLLQLLKKDFGILNQAIPIDGSNVSQNRMDSSQKQKKQKGGLQGSSQVGRKSRKVPTIPSTDEYFSKSPQSIIVTKKQKDSYQKVKIPEKQVKKSAIQLEAVSQVQSVIENMFKEYGKVTLHDVQLILDDGSGNFDLGEDMNDMYNEHQIYDAEESQAQEQQTVDDYILEMLSSISKIKIGRVELHNPRFLEEIRNKLSDADSDDKSKK